MKPKCIFPSVVVFILSGHWAFAQSIWSGGGGNWTSTVSPGWTSGGVPNAIDAIADAQALGGTLTVNGNFIVGTLIQAGSVARSVNATGTNGLTFDVTAVGGTALWDMRGGLTGTGTSGGTSHSTNIVLNDNTEIRGLVSTGSSGPSFSGVISGAGQLQLTNVATTPSGGGIRYDLRNGSNSYGGGTLIGQGTALRLNASGAAGTGTITLADSAAAGTNNLDFRVDSSNATQVHANNINFGTRGSGGNTILSLQNNTMTVTLNGALSGTMGSSGRASLNGGALVLGGSSANTWTGQFRSDTHGTIIADKVGAINNGFDMRSQVAGSTTALLLGVADTITGQISLNGNNSGSGFTYMGQIGLKDGNTGIVTLNNANKINLANVFGGVGGTDLAPNGASLNLHSGNTTGTLIVTTEIGQNTNARSISITGTGTVNLNRGGGNTYTGSTTVSGGTLLASNTTGSATGGGALNVNSSTRLGGTGTIAPSGANGITISGVLAPGASIGNLTLNLGGTTGTVAMASGSSFEYELGIANPTIDAIVANSSDLLTLAGAAAADFAFSSNNVDFVNTGAVGYYKLFDTLSNNANTYTGLTFDGTTGLVTNGLSYSNLAGGQTGNFIVGTASNGGVTGDIYFQVIPEPSAALLGGLGLLALLRRRDRNLFQREGLR